METALECHGLFHVLTSRICFNIAIIYETMRRFEEAYENFKQSYIIKRQVCFYFHFSVVSFRQRHCFRKLWYVPCANVKDFLQSSNSLRNNAEIRRCLWMLQTKLSYYCSGVCFNLSMSLCLVFPCFLEFLNISGNLPMALGSWRVSHYWQLLPTWHGPDFPCNLPQIILGLTGTEQSEISLKISTLLLCCFDWWFELRPTGTPVRPKNPD